MKNLETNFQQELLDIAYKHLRLSSIAILVSAMILGFIVYEFVDIAVLSVWLLLISLISLYRFYMALEYNSNPHKYSKEMSEKRFYIALILSSLLWTLPPFLFFIEDNYMVQAMILVIYAGLVAGGMSALSSLDKALRIFLFLVITPLMIALFMQNTPNHFMIAILVAFYYVMTLKIGGLFYRNYQSIFQMKKRYIEEKEKSLISNERFKFLFKEAPIGFFFYDNDLIIREANQKLADSLDVSKEKLIGLDLKNLPDQSFLPTLKAAIDNMNGYYEGEYRSKFQKKDMFVVMQTSAIKDTAGDVIGAMGMFHDITDKMLAQQKIEHQAKYDVLTNIPNRLTLKEKIESELHRYQKHGIIFAVLFLDLDHFKNINDSLGHALGDELLISVAKRLESVIKPEDTVARLGGDEFVILLPDLSKDDKKSASKAEHIAVDIYNLFEKPIVVGDHQLNLSTSIGIALVSDEDESADDVLKHADIAMYQAKKDGRSCNHFYKQEMDTWIKRRVELESALRNALTNGELQVYYQPIVDLDNGSIIGAESLLRWNSKEFGNISPVEFIPIAEDSGLILPIGNFVMKNAFEQFVKWQQEYADLMNLETIAINISVRQFNNADFVSSLKEMIKQSGIDPMNIELELVESIIIDDLEKAKIKMQELKKLGIGLSIDDFGTGYSSLSYLKQLPFTTLKIDQSFVKDIEVDPEDKELIETILNIAKRFRLKVVAEGVETKEQYHFLKEKGCDFYQGYLCSKALDNDSFVKLFS